MTDGAVVSLWRYPVKSMMGEELNASDVTDRGLLGDRSLALVDTETGKVVSAKNPRKWPTMFDFRAVFTTPPVLGSALPPVRVTLPDGVSVTSDDARFAELLTGALGRSVTLASAAPSEPSLEEHWPDIAELAHRESDRRSDALHYVLRPRQHPCAHHGDDQPATRSLPAGPIRGQALPASCAFLSPRVLPSAASFARHTDNTAPSGLIGKPARSPKRHPAEGGHWIVS